MIKVLDTIKFRTTESSPLPGAQPNNFGLLFSSASSLGAYTTLYFTNTAGQTFDLTDANSGSINILYYTGSNVGDGTTKTYTWTKRPNLRLLKVICLGAGGGGGSGMSKGNSGVFLNARGGTGGGGGGLSYAQFFAEELSNSVPITVGAGGAGGLSVQGTLNNGAIGNSGSNGGNTFFGSPPLVLGEGGRGGRPGSSSTAFGSGVMSANYGGGVNNVPSYPFSFGGSWGGGENNSSVYSGLPAGQGGGVLPTTAGYINSVVAVIDNTSNMPAFLRNFVTGSWLGRRQIAGGGGGNGGSSGGIPTSPPINSLSGGSGSGAGGLTYSSNTLTQFILPNSNTQGGITSSTDVNITTGSSGLNNLGVDTITQLVQNFPLKGFTASYGFGGGGGGGASINSSTFSPSTIGGSGGNGGLYGAGGGGGGGTINFNGLSGRGGSGSSGLCILVEYY